MRLTQIALEQDLLNEGPAIRSTFKTRARIISSFSFKSSSIGVQPPSIRATPSLAMSASCTCISRTVIREPRVPEAKFLVTYLNPLHLRESISAKVQVVK